MIEKYARSLMDEFIQMVILEHERKAKDKVLYAALCIRRDAVKKPSEEELLKTLAALGYRYSCVEGMRREMYRAQDRITQQASSDYQFDDDEATCAPLASSVTAQSS